MVHSRSLVCSIALFLAIGVLFTGCVGLKPKADPTRFYVLETDTPQATEPRRVDVALRRLELPDYLDNSRVVVRVSEVEVRYRGLHRWAGGALGPMLEQATGNGIERADPNLRVSAGGVAPAAFLLDLRVLRFEGGPGKTAHFAFEWSLIHAEGRSTTATGRIVREADWDGEDVAVLVESLAGLIRSASAELGARIVDTRQEAK